MLPRVVPSSHLFGTTRLEGVDVPIMSAAGDQQAALFGQACFEKGDVKNTYGTGCFLLMNIGSQMHISEKKMLTTLSAGTQPGAPEYLIEGSVFVGGAVIQWLRDELGILDNAAESELFASQVRDNGGIVIVPAFTGLGAPYWDMYARGTIFGLTRGVGKNHIIRAALESIALQSRDLVDAIVADTGIPIHALKVDGGASANTILMQFQADILNCEVLRPVVKETTALGAAYLAGLTCGIWDNTDDIRKQWTLDRQFSPSMDTETRARLIHQWHRAIERTKGWL
jgi:glycerol kinase